MTVTRGQKQAHVRGATQTRSHHCHWPGCDKQVPPAKWGCAPHWFAIPKPLRDRIWDTYRPGQEATMSPSTEYLAAADAVQRWITEQANATRRPGAPKDEVASFEKRPMEADVSSELASIALWLATSRGDVTVQMARVREEWSERAAIREYVGGIDRVRAEHYALIDTGYVVGAYR